MWPWFGAPDRAAACGCCCTAAPLRSAAVALTAAVAPASPPPLPRRAAAPGAACTPRRPPRTAALPPARLIGSCAGCRVDFLATHYYGSRLEWMAAYLRECGCTGWAGGAPAKACREGGQADTAGQPLSAEGSLPRRPLPCFCTAAAPGRGWPCGQLGVDSLPCTFPPPAPVQEVWPAHLAHRVCHPQPGRPARAQLRVPGGCMGRLTSVH